MDVGGRDRVQNLIRLQSSSSFYSDVWGEQPQAVLSSLVIPSVAFGLSWSLPSLFWTLILPPLPPLRDS